MKPTHVLSVISLLLLTIFSCKKSEIPAEKVKLTATKATLTGDEGNVHVFLSNPDDKAVFAVIQILPGDQPGSTPIDEKIINLNEVEENPITDVFFDILPGTYYQVRVIDTYGQNYFMPSTTATEYQATTSFFRLINAPGIIKSQPDPNPPAPPYYPNDDRQAYPEIPGVNFPFKVNPQSFPGGELPVEVQLVPYIGAPAVQTRALRYYYNNSWHSTHEAVFYLMPGFTFHVLVRGESGSIKHSSMQTSYATLQQISF